MTTPTNSPAQSSGAWFGSWISTGTITSETLADLPFPGLTSLSLNIKEGTLAECTPGFNSSCEAAYQMITAVKNDYNTGPWIIWMQGSSGKDVHPAGRVGSLLVEVYGSGSVDSPAQIWANNIPDSFSNCSTTKQVKNVDLGVFGAGFISANSNQGWKCAEAGILSLIESPTVALSETNPVWIISLFGYTGPTPYNAYQDTGFWGLAPPANPSIAGTPVPGESGFVYPPNASGVCIGEGLPFTSAAVILGVDPPIPNPPVFSGANPPTDRQGLVFDAINNAWVPTDLQPAGALSSINTQTTAQVLTPTVVSGTAFTVDADNDAIVNVPVVATTTGTLTITFGPTVGNEYTPVPSMNLVALSGVNQSQYLPAGWSMIVTVTGGAAIGIVSATVLGPG